MLSLENVHTFYGAIEALKGVSIDIAAGEIVTLIGANGAGKSTLLMTICGTPRARMGRVLFSGDDIRSEEHTSELQSLMRISYAVFCLKKKKSCNKLQLCN